jgi:two-component system KDP operon response regulator KdpE
MASPAADTTYASRWSGRPVLIADDDPPVRRFLRTYLASLGVTDVTEAGNGVEVIELARQRPDLELVILDLMMPVMDGVETIRELRAANPHIGLIVITAYPDYPGILNAANRGPVFLMKPLELDDLHQALDVLLA